jgi:hypothetical protein
MVIIMLKLQKSTWMYAYREAFQVLRISWTFTLDMGVLYVCITKHRCLVTVTDKHVLLSV